MCFVFVPVSSFLYRSVLAIYSHVFVHVCVCVYRLRSVSHTDTPADNSAAQSAKEWTASSVCHVGSNGQTANPARSIPENPTNL